VSQGVNGLGVDVLTIKGELIGNKGDVAVIGEIVEKLGEPLLINAGKSLLAEVPSPLLGDGAKLVQLLLGDCGDIQHLIVDEPLQVLFVDLGELAVDGIPQLVVVIGELGDMCAVLPALVVTVPLGVIEVGGEQT